jgi:hypothetical protein
MRSKNILKLIRKVKLGTGRELALGLLFGGEVSLYFVSITGSGWS